MKFKYKNWVIICIIISIWSCKQDNATITYVKEHIPFISSKSEIIALDSVKLISKLNELSTFIKKNNTYNSDIVMLMDMNLPSNQYRYFVYNLKNKSLIKQGIVAHGIGSNAKQAKDMKFSNVPNSLCTSLGKYSIGYSYDGQFGKAYKLHGLDTTNDNAFKRYIVLHRYKKVPYEPQTKPIFNSEGCPMVSEKFFLELETIIDGSKKPILLYIYN